MCVLPISNGGAKVISCLTFCLETDVALSGSHELNMLHKTLKTTPFCIFSHFLFCHNFATRIPVIKGQTSSNIKGVDLA